MPITKSAKKALHGSLRKKAVNDRRKKTMKEEIKKVEKMSLSDKKEAKKMLSVAYSAIDKAAKRGVINKNTASRKKARLSKITK